MRVSLVDRVRRRYA